MNSNTGNKTSLRPRQRRRRSSYTKAEIKQGARESFYTLIDNGYFKLTMAMIFFSLSIVYYKKAEQWNAVDCVLFVIVSASTVGYGNIHPTNESSRVYTIFLMIFGAFVVYAGLIAYLNSGIVRMNIFLAKSVTSRLKRTEVLFQRRLALSILWVFACAIIGALVLQALENLSFITALYFAVQTMMTVGYGDVSFNHQSTKIFLIFFIILSTTLLSLAINNIYAVIQNRKVLNERRSLLKLQRKLHFLADLNDGRGVGRFEFVLTILEHIGTLDHDKDIAPWLKKFRALDTYDSGILNQQQLALFSEQHAQQCETEIEEIEQIALSTSNVQSLPAAAPSLSRPLSMLSDFRQRAMTVGLFSDQELYEAEQFDETDNDNTSIQSDLGDPDSAPDSDPDPEGGKARYQLTPSGKFQGLFRSRPRASTTRKYSTAGHHSDEEEDGEDEMVSPMSLGLNSISGISSSPAAVTTGVGGSNRHWLPRQSSGRRGRAVRSSDSPHRSPPASVSLSARLLDDTTNNPLHPHPSVELLPMHTRQKAPPVLPNTPPAVSHSPHISPVSAPPSPHTSRDTTQRTARHAYYSSEDDYDLDTQQEGEFTYNTLLAASRDSGSVASAGSCEAPAAPMLWLTPPSCPAPPRSATRSASSMHGPTGAVGLPPRHPPSSAHSHITSADLASRGSSRYVTPERADRGQGSSDQITPEKTNRDRVGTEAAAGEHATMSRLASESPSDANISTVRPWQSPSDHASRSTPAPPAAVVVTEEKDSAAQGVHEIDCVDDANTL